MYMMIAELEAKAVVRALHAFEVSPTTPIDLVIDNTTVLYSIVKGRSASFWLNKHISTITEYTIKSVSYIRSADNVADGLSRTHWLSQGVPTTSSEFGYGKAQAQPDQHERKGQIVDQRKPAVISLHPGNASNSIQPPHVRLLLESL